MPLTPSEQTSIQESIDTATPEKLAQLKAQAEDALHMMSMVKQYKTFTAQEKKEGEQAVEFLVRLEGKKLGKGWLFRTKRRIQLTQQYL